MSSIAFNSSLSSASPVTATGQQVPRNNASATSTASTADSVSLSPTAQATALQQQGYTVNEIASTLGLTSATVDSYLDIATASSSGGGGVPAGGPSQSGAPHSVAAAAGSTTTASTTAAPSKSSPAAAETPTVKATPKQQ